MNLAIEYMMRQERARSIFISPCSLCVITDQGHNLVVGINNHYGHPTQLVVKHWKLWESKKIDILPPFDEHIIERDQVFESPYVVIPGHHLLSYEEDPFPAGSKQSSDMPYSQQQEHEYNETLDHFYNSKTHRKKRSNWLWTSFARTYIPDDLLFQHGTDDVGLDLQKEIIRFYSKTIWNVWMYWQRYLINFPGPAGELVFACQYSVH